MSKEKPWIEKYRAIKLNDIMHQNEVISMLQTSIKTGSLPHLLFYGPPGTGKTSTAQAIARELFGPINIKNRLLELNASDERGINVVRNKIVEFAKSMVSYPDPAYPSPPFKIIILDEADAMTIEAQSALRKTIEEYSTITRFCFVCNYINQIIDPIVSRCVNFRFKPINNDIIYNKLLVISQLENMSITPSLLKLLSEKTDGDMRTAIMLLQNLQYISHDIKKDDIDDICGCLSDYIIDKINKTCIINKKKPSILCLYELVNEIKSYSYPIENVLEQISLLIINSPLSDKQKSQICIEIGSSEKKLIDGSDEKLQLLNILVKICDNKN